MCRDVVAFVRDHREGTPIRGTALVTRKPCPKVFVRCAKPLRFADPCGAVLSCRLCTHPNHLRGSRVLAFHCFLISPLHGSLSSCSSVLGTCTSFPQLPSGDMCFGLAAHCWRESPPSHSSSLETCCTLVPQTFTLQEPREQGEGLCGPCLR